MQVTLIRFAVRFWNDPLPTVLWVVGPASLLVLFWSIVEWPPKGSADVAAWVQAFGSIGALAIAVLLQVRQGTQQLIQSNTACVRLAEHLWNTLAATEGACLEEKRDAVVKKGHALGRLGEMALQVRIDNLSPELADPFLAMVELVTEAKFEADRTGSTAVSLRHQATVFEGLRKRAGEVMNEIARARAPSEPNF